jgi:hypothetical protein
MANNSIEHRRAQYFRLSSQLARLDNTQLSCLFDNDAADTGWGKSYALEIDGSRVFTNAYQLLIPNTTTFSPPEIFMSYPLITITAWARRALERSAN